MISTAISDAVLAAATLWAAWRIANAGHTAAGLAMALIVVPAVLGALRFSGLDELAALHERASLFAATGALPVFCVAFGYAGRTRQAMPMRYLPGLLVLSLLAAVAIREPPYTVGIGALALLYALHGAQRTGIRPVLAWSLVAVVTYVVAGLVIGTTGEWVGVLRVDLYHYGLAAANLAFAQAANAMSDARVVREQAASGE